MLWGSHHKDEVPQHPITDGELSPQMRNLLDHDDSFYDDVYTPYSVDSTETPYRYAGYANRIRTLLLSAHRYVAYTSDIGESFRPIAHPYLVRSAYAISWTYLLGDVAHEGYKAYLRNRRVLAPPCEAYKDSRDLTHQNVVKGMATGNIGGALSPPVSARAEAQADAGADTLTPWPTARIPLIEDYRTVMAQRAVFQGLASMGLPALAIHSVVKYSGRMLRNQKSVFLRTWVPVGLGLSIVPFLPYVFDKPVEEAVDWAFRSGLRLYAGEDAVRPLPRHSEIASGIAAAAATRKEGDDTSLSHFHINIRETAGEQQSATTGGANMTWEEYREELRRAKEQRKREREERGESGPLALLRLSSLSQSSSKDKTE